MDEVEIKPNINEQEDDFLDSVPDLVDKNDPLRYLQASWDPNAEYANVD